MDIFKQNRFLSLVVAVLVILNLATLGMLWMGRPRRPVPPSRPAAAEVRQAPEDRLLEELGFDDAQVEQYRRLTRLHRESMRTLNEEVRAIKKRMFDGVLAENPTPELSESLLAQAQAKQAEIEQRTYQYFLDLKKLCRPDQQQKLKLLLDEAFRGAPEGRDEGRRQPPPGRDDGGPQPSPRRPPAPDREPPPRRPPQDR